MQPLEEGQRFERYRIQRKLGSGTSGDSYEAEDIRLQRKVTLKLIYPWLPLSDAARRQFFREMQDLSMLTHPYLAELLDYGEVSGQIYVARRFVGPGSLLGSEGRYWFQPPLPVIDAIRLAHQLAQTLQYVHNSGFLHGSLTLSNILVLHGLNSQSQAHSAPFLLADIGMAHFVRRFGQPKVTLLPITAAPEQLGKRSTPASDQYALAVMLYFWLAGQPPFLGAPEEIEHLKLTETIPSLTKYNPSITAEQEAIIRRALCVYPEERYPSIIAFTDALLISLLNPAQEEILSKPLPASAHFEEPAIEPYQSAPLQAPVSLSSLKIEQEASPELNLNGEARKEQEADLPAPSSLNGAAPEGESHNHHGTTAVASASTNSSIASARFTVVSPYTTERREVAIEREETTLGRAGSSDILLDFDEQTSRHHALLKREGEHYVLYDRRSISGTFVNGKEIPGENGCALADGDVVKVGVYELVFHLQEAPNSPHSAIS